MSIRNTCLPMEIETVTDTTVPNHDETEIESTEFEKNQKRYQDLISTFPHVKGWGFKDPFISDFFICSYLKTGERAFTKSAYFRKGKTGDWVNYLTPDMAARIDGIMEEKFKGTGLLEYGK
ncbi:BnaC06g24240D [Brassica napus]|uniref:Sulfotransferase n=1 Tax=Brassica napus TaxID=3708 RepID=A0A078IKU3_BRANA|nr:BnaC06g24240D [Brassica napus]